MSDEVERQKQTAKRVVDSLLQDLQDASGVAVPEGDSGRVCCECGARADQAGTLYLHEHPGAVLYRCHDCSKCGCRECSQSQSPSERNLP